MCFILKIDINILHRAEQSDVARELQRVSAACLLELQYRILVKGLVLLQIISSHLS